MSDPKDQSTRPSQLEDGAARDTPLPCEVSRMRASKLKRRECTFPESLPSRAIKTRARAEGGGKEGHSYKPLPVEFRSGGLNYRQIAREGMWAIYEQTWSRCAEPSVSYEVIRIRLREGFQINGRFVEPAETYPKPDAWGVDGFTFTDKDAAFAKQRELTGGQK
jgi:hypothetical protein